MTEHTRVKPAAGPAGDRAYDKPGYMEAAGTGSSATANEMRDAKASTPDHPFLTAEQIEWRWIRERNHANAYIKHPTRTVMAILEEVPPGGNPTSLHRHAVEAVYYVLQGRGRSLVGNKYYDWKPGDSFYVAPFAWHQHWCFSEEPARFIACTNAELMNYLDTQIFEERGVDTTWEKEHDENGRLKSPNIIDERY
jgi:gentisate 1,2-dioxygenase